jgi:hypothetical protein
LTVRDARQIVLNGQAVRQRVERLDRLLQQLESLADQHAREVAVSAVQSLLELYGEALARVMHRVPPDASRALADDELIGHLLLVHGLHPVDVETRVRDALGSLPRSLGRVELLGVQDGTARVRVPAACAADQVFIERAIQDAAPDVDAVAFETGAASSSFVALDTLVRR